MVLLGLFSRRSKQPGTVPSGSGNRWEELLEEQPLPPPDPEPAAVEPVPRMRGAGGRLAARRRARFPLFYWGTCGRIES